MILQASVALILAFSVVLFFWSLRRVLRIIFSGKATHLESAQKQRLITALLEVFFHRKLLRQKSAGLLHFIIFWGFLVLSLGTLDWFIYGLTGTIRFSHLFPFPIASAYLLSQDLFNGLVLIAVLYAYWRRIVIKPARMADNSASSRRDAYLILGLIAGLVVSSLLTHAILIQNGDEADFILSQPLASLFGSLIWGEATVSQGTYWFWWWAHLAIILVFLNYLPYSKHFHVMAAFPNVLLSKVEPRGRLSTPNLEDETVTSFGAEKIEDLKWKSILDSFACTECGRCNEFCPTATTQKELRPKTLMISLRAAASHRQPLVAQVQAGNLALDQLNDSDKALFEQTLVPQVFSDQFVWDCTTCGACVEACPVMIDHVDTIVEMRRALVLNRGSNPDEATNVFRNWESNSNPWGLPESSRQDWLVEKGIPLYEAGAEFDYLYYIGCAGSFDDRNKKVVESVIKILQSAGVSFGILGKEERCNGETARRMGNEWLAQQMMRTNLELLQGRGVKKVITSCPHCFNTLKNEYPVLGAGFETIHHTQLIQSLLEQGKLAVEKKSNDAITFHDSCYIGRYNNIYDEPRKILSQVSEQPLVELKRSKEKGFCCGAGGGRMWLEETTGTRINQNRADEVIASKANTLGVSCPFCMTMLTDGLKQRDRGDIQVKDIAEIVAEQLSAEKV